MKTILVTGSTDGIGFETALELALLGHEVVLHGRNEEKVQVARKEILRSSPHSVIHTACCDLADLGAVALMGHKLNVRFPKLDVLINNAGVYMTERKLSKNGFEMTLAVNHIAHFLLSVLLRPLLRRSSDPRVVTVSSNAHTGGRIDFDNLNCERHFDAYRAYANSKLANALFAYELAKRESWLCSNCLHPGVIDTKLLRAGFSITGATVVQAHAPQSTSPHRMTSEAHQESTSTTAQLFLARHLRRITNLRNPYGSGQLILFCLTFRLSLMTSQKFLRRLA